MEHVLNNDYEVKNVPRPSLWRL